MKRLIAASLSVACMALTGFANENQSGTPGESSTDKPTAASKRAYKLRYRFQANQVVSYLAEQNTKITVSKGDRSRVTRNGTVTRKHFTVISAQPDGSAILEPMIDHVKMTAQFNKEKPQTYDSAKDGKPPQGYYGAAQTIGRALVRIKVSATGELVGSIPLLSRKVQARVVPDKGPAKPSNDPSKNFLVVFPEKPIHVGDSWSDRLLKPRLHVGQRGSGLLQEFPLIRTYRLVSVKGDLATIRLETASVKPLRDVGLQIQAAQLLPSATIVFDMRRGLIVSRIAKTESKVHGGAGPGTLLHVSSLREEKLVPKKLAAAAKTERKD